MENFTLVSISGIQIGISIICSIVMLVGIYYLHLWVQDMSNLIKSNIAIALILIPLKIQLDFNEQNVFTEKTERGSYIVKTQFSSINVYKTEKTKIVDGTEIKYKEELKQITSIKCGMTTPYKQCIEQFLKNEDELTSHIKASNS